MFLIGQIVCRLGWRILWQFLRIFREKGIFYIEKGLFFFELIWCVLSLSLSHPSVRF